MGGAADAYHWNILFGGYYYDRDTGLYLVRNRAYHPDLGRWLQPDPLGYADSANLYEYCGGDPLNCVDPTGEEPVTIGLLIGVGIALLGVGGAHYGAHEMSVAVDKGDPDRFRKRQIWFAGGLATFGVGVSVIAAPAASALGTMGAGAFGLTANTLRFSMVSGAIAGAAEGPMLGGLMGGLSSYSAGGSAQEGAFWGAAVGLGTGPLFGAAWGGASWGFGQFRTLRRGDWQEGSIVAQALNIGQRGPYRLFYSGARQMRAQAIVEEAAQAIGIRLNDYVDDVVFYTGRFPQFAVWDGRRTIAIARSTLRRTRAGQLISGVHELAHARHSAKLGHAKFLRMYAVEKARFEILAEARAVRTVQRYLGGLSRQQLANSARYINYHIGKMVLP